MQSTAKVLVTLAVLWVCTEAKRDYTSYCGACKAVIDELRYSISKEDQYKTIQTGNFRVDSRGKQGGIKEVKYAGSETHISELLDNVCEQMQNYGETSDPQTGKKGYMRINSRAGETITISNVNFSSGGTQQLRAACDYFVSEFEDDIMSTLQAEELSREDMEEELCADITGYCREGHRTEL